MAKVLAKFKKRLIEEGHWDRLQVELVAKGEDSTIVLHVECGKEDLMPRNLLEQYLGAKDEKEATATVACGQHSLLGDNNGFVIITVRNTKVLLAAHPIVLVSYAVH